MCFCCASGTGATSSKIPLNPNSEEQSKSRKLLLTPLISKSHKKKHVRGVKCCQLESKR